MPFQCACGGKSVKAKSIDVSWDALTACRQYFQSFRSEQSRSTVACHSQPVLNVGFDILPSQWCEPSQNGYTLPQLRKLWSCQFFRELRLSRNDDLKQLVAGCFEV